MAACSYFVTGTDTGTGKTWCSAALLRVLRRNGQRVAGIKPVASGCMHTQEGLRSSDALALIAQSNVELPYEVVNPYAFAPPIAPHIAARRAAVRIDLDRIHKIYQHVANQADCVVVEGVGGWQVPLSDQETIADLAHRLGLPIILVVGMRLGCINHALLSVASIEQSGLELAGWIANHIEPGMIAQAENLATLKTRIAAPLLGEVAHAQGYEPTAIAAALRI